jgi:hypothetical protein
MPSYIEENSESFPIQWWKIFSEQFEEFSRHMRRWTGKSSVVCCFYDFCTFRLIYWISLKTLLEYVPLSYSVAIYWILTRIFDAMWEENKKVNVHHWLLCDKSFTDFYLIFKVYFCCKCVGMLEWHVKLNYWDFYERNENF